MNGLPKVDAPTRFDQHVFDSNMAAISERWPKVYAWLLSAKDPQNVVLVEEYQHPTLMADGIHLSSVFAPLREAQLQAALAPENEKRVCCYGVGLGELPRVLLRRDNLSHLSVVVIAPGVTRQVLGLFDQTDWLSDPRVELVCGDSGQSISYPFCAVASELFLADDSTARLRDKVFLELQTPFIHSQHEKQRERLQGRFLDNVSFFEQDGKVSELFGTMEGKTILVAGAGPTLGDRYDWIKKYRDKVGLIAVDAAFKPLSLQGIYPDAVIAVDAHEGLAGLFSYIVMEPARSIPLVYFPQVVADLLSSWPGPRLLACSANPLHDEIRETYRCGTLYSSGSVIHPATDLAVQMGASRIVFLGADFGFPHDRFHVENYGVGVQEETFRHGSHWVLNGFGERIRTTSNLRNYLVDLENYIATKPQVEFCLCCREGASITGVDYLEELDV